MVKQSTVKKLGAIGLTLGGLSPSLRHTLLKDTFSWAPVSTRQENQAPPSGTEKKTDMLALSRHGHFPFQELKGLHGGTLFSQRNAEQ